MHSGITVLCCLSVVCFTCNTAHCLDKLCWDGDSQVRVLETGIKYSEKDTMTSQHLEAEEVAHDVVVT